MVGKAVYFARLNPKGITEKTIESDVACGEVSGTALENFRTLVADLYVPIIQEQQAWGKVPQEHTAEFKTTSQKFGSMLSEAVSTVNGGVELRIPEQRYVERYDLKPSSLNQAAADESAMNEFEDCLSEWCKETETLLRQTNRIKDGEEPGPDTELEYWRTRMSNFNSITEQLKSRECKLVLGVCAAAKSKAYARWRSLDIQVRNGASQLGFSALAGLWGW